MATALQKQLAAIAASSTHQLDLKAQKSAHGKSLLFEPHIAASQSFENIYHICHDGYRDLCALDSRFLPFAKSLFSEQSKAEDRTQMSQAENKKLDSVLGAFITLVGPRLLLKPAEKALEWLVRRFRVHEYNTECLVFTYLPYHKSPQFLALLSILPATPPHAIRFLFPYIQSPTSPPRRTIAYTAVNTPIFFKAYQSYVTKVVQAGHQASHMLSFWSSITVEAIFGILNNSSSGRRLVQDQKIEELVLQVLPVINDCMQSKYGSETVTACYTIIVILVNQAKVGDKVLDGLFEAVVSAQDEGSVNECLACLAIIASERSKAPVSNKATRRLLSIPHLTLKLQAVSKQCQVDRLALACALGALGNVSQSEDNLTILYELVGSGLLAESRMQTLLSALVLLLRDSALGSQEHGQLLQVATKLTESKHLLDEMQKIAMQNSVNLDLVGLTIETPSEIERWDVEDEKDEEMLDADDMASPSRAELIELPSIRANSFLDVTSANLFTETVDAFAEAVSTGQTQRLLASPELRREHALDQSLYLSFLARVWSSTRSIPTRIAALRAAIVAVKGQPEVNPDLQNILPYLLYALADPSPLIRRSAAAFGSALPTNSSMGGKPKPWGATDIYGKSSSKMSVLKGDEYTALLSSMLKPILEECAMDANFIITAFRDLLEGSQTSRSQLKHSLKSQLRISILSFFASHASLTPVLRVRLCLLPIFNFRSKISDPVRSSVILPLTRQWCSLSAAEASSTCENEDLELVGTESRHLDALVPKEIKSVQLLHDIITGSLSKERTLLAIAAFDRINQSWTTLKSESRLMLAESMLDLSLTKSNDLFNILCRERANEILRNVKLDSAALVIFLESMPSAVHMPEGPPAKKRRRTSRNEMARVELSSQTDIDQILKRLTLVLELIEGSDPGKHPALFKPLFSVFGDLQPLKQQSESELVYLQSIILGSLTPIVETLKGQSDTVDYQAAVRADLLIDCIRHSTSPQVQNSALLLIANLASWVPDLVLHNLMPIFTFIGSTLLRQQDDYSAQVVDKTISRVVPQLAASLRSRHKNFLTGVSDLLLSFTAAFEHVPSHRRLKLFSELARTLGPDDSLSAIIALLIDRYHNHKTQLRFSTDLLLVFDPIHTLSALKGYLDLVVDAVNPKPKISDTLFGLNEKGPALVETTLKDLLSGLADLATEERLRNHVTRAFRRKDDASKPREVFATIVETIIQVSKKVASSPKLYDCCSRVIARCLDLLPTADLTKSAELLFSNTDLQVQVAAIKAVELRAGVAAQNDRKSIAALLEFLPSVENLLQSSPETDAKIISISCIDRIIERFGKKDTSRVTSVAQTISGSESLSSSDDRIRILSLLCLTSVVDVLEDEAISLLPTVMPTIFEYLAQAIEEKKTGLHNAVYTLLSNVIERLGYMFLQEYLDTALRLSQRSAAADLDDACDASRRGFYQSISENLAVHETFVAIKSTWPQAVCQGFDASIEHLELLQSTVELQPKNKLIKASSALFSLLLQTFRLREAIESQSEEEFDEDEIEQLDSTLVESTLAMVLKLNDATFRPFFIQLIDQEGPVTANPQHSVTFYTFLAAFFAKFKSIVTSYSAYIIEHTAQTLSLLAEADTQTHLRGAVLAALQKTFQHDQDGFWQAPSHYGAIMPPLLSLLTLPSASTSTPQNNTNNIIPTITELAAASASSIDNHREMNAILLRYMRNAKAHTRLATVLCEQSLTRRLGEEWLGLLPEMLPFISELREDDDEIVERETQRWITGVEEVLGESLEGMLL